LTKINTDNLTPEFKAKHSNWFSPAEVKSIKTETQSVTVPTTRQVGIKGQRIALQATEAERQAARERDDIKDDTTYQNEKIRGLEEQELTNQTQHKILQVSRYHSESICQVSIGQTRRI